MTTRLPSILMLACCALALSACARGPSRTVAREAGARTAKAAAVEAWLERFAEKTPTIAGLAWIDLSDGTSIDVDGRYASKTGSFDAGIDIEGIAKLYGGDDGWVAIRYDASHVLVGKRVAGGASEGE